MASRPRSISRRNWPQNLYAKERNGPYYFWRHPETGSEFGLGRDLTKAKIQAIEANLKVQGMAGKRRLVDRISDEGHGTVREFIPVFRAIVVARKVAPNTLKTLNSNLRKIDAAIGELIMRRVTTQDLNDRVTEPLTLACKARAATQVRSVLNEMWLEAAGKGKVDTNPVATLKVATPEVKRQRLTLEQFKVIHAASLKIKDEWITHMLELAIVSAQPRECLGAWLFSDSHDDFLWNERGKTGARIKLPLELKVPELGWVLGDVVKSCRDRVISRHMLHHNIPRTKAKPGDPISLNALSKGFARARGASGLKFDGVPPSLHEVRSLALRLYKDAYGRDYAQAIAGHKSGSTTDIYTDVRGAEWIEVRAA